MATEIIDLALAGPEKIVASITEVFIIQQFKDCYNLEENHEDLNKKVKSMETELRHVQDRFKEEGRVLQGPAQECITEMKVEIKKARELSDRIDKRRSWCLDCWNLCYPKLSTECRKWKTKFDKLPEELQKRLNLLATVEQILPAAAFEAKPVVLQDVPADGFIGSFMESGRLQLQRWLTESPCPVVGVWGRGGVGKTSLLQLIYNHFKVSGIFEDVIWVVVSQKCEVEGLQKSIAKKLHLKFEESFDNDERRTILSNHLGSKKFLVILDDVWEKIDFGKVGIRFGNDKGSKVVISTRNFEVIAAMGAEECSLKMQILSEDEAWELFKGIAFKNGPAALDSNIEAIAKDIAKECKGLPLAVNVVGAAMTPKKTEAQWNSALDLMRSADPNFPMSYNGIDADLYQKLMYSYNDLSDHKLKCCFLYCAAFPEDEEINAKRLVEMWIAEGFVTGRERTDLMDVGHGYLDLLANRCLIQYVVPGEYVPSESSYEYVKTIKIHDVLRDMAIHIVESEKHWFFATDQHLTKFPRGKEIRNCNRILLGHNNIQDLPTDPMECPNLVSLLLPSNNSLRDVPQPFLSSVISLRVLDLSWTRITGLPTSVGELTQLEFLDLSYCRELIELPQSMGNLSALQFFNLKGCSELKGLPSTIIRGLKELKHLNLDGCFQRKVNSDDIGKLTSLNRLEVGDTAVRACDLKNLDKMRVLIAEVTSDGGHDVTLDTWTAMKHLQLSFQSNGVNIGKIETVEMLHLNRYGGVTLPNCEFKKLQVLKLSGCDGLSELPFQSFPMLTVLRIDGLLKLESLSGPSNVWNEGSMSKLQELIIENCPLLKKFPLGRLPNLKVLYIQWCDSIKELDIGNGDFPILVELQLNDLKELESITGSSGVWNEEAKSKLESLSIYECPLLKKLPLGMRLPNLKVLYIQWCDSIKELGIGNGDFPMLEELVLLLLPELDIIIGSSGVWNEEATSKLESVDIRGCPLIMERLPTAIENLLLDDDMWDKG